MAESQTKAAILERHRANELLRAATYPVVQRTNRDLSIEYPTIPPAGAIIEASVSALQQGQTHYVDVPGIAPLREQIAAFLGGRGLHAFQADNVIVTAGVQESRFLTIQMIGDLFGSIALPQVAHPGVRKAAGVRHLEIRHLPANAGKGLLPSLDAIRTTLQAGCRLLYLESPSRLTGAVFSQADVEQIGALLAQYDAAAIWDQGLAPWVATGHYASLAAQPAAAQRVAVLGEVWPGVGIDSWQLGYLAANPDWVAPMRSQKQIMSICTSTPAQYAALKAKDVYATTHDGQLEELEWARSEAVKLTQAAGVEPLPGSVVTLLAVRTAKAETTLRSLHERGFEVGNGADMGAPGVLRFAVMPDTTRQALQCLVEG